MGFNISNNTSLQLLTAVSNGAIDTSWGFAEPFVNVTVGIPKRSETTPNAHLTIDFGSDFEVISTIILSLLITEWKP
ncbi:hypothetical protein C479_03531 [Halovivax asiaticus JCM 14624]|uniref:Uncharacterized protein n=1 Tax=Halovivax asiaticus JCM 14624 TaxID=1227490 RepID=M0BSG0_9EURY|nr:hypothetical protein C479_03531 [Halovivax asiaticus JCM 14624]